MSPGEVIEQDFAREEAPRPRCPTCGSALKPSGQVMFSATTPHVIIGCISFKMTWQQFMLVRLLYENRPRVLNRDYILTALWPIEADQPDSEVIDVQLCRARKILRPQKYLTIETVWGQGYRAVVDQSDG